MNLNQNKVTEEEAKAVVDPQVHVQNPGQVIPRQSREEGQPVEENNVQEGNSELQANECEDSNELGANTSKQKESGESPKESAENDGENEGEQQAAPQNNASNGGRKCFNKLCTSKKIYKKIRSRVQHAKYRFLCKQCYENYTKNFYCQFCQQIYSNYQGEDQDSKWIGCDNCDRWNHIECERKYRDKNIVECKDNNIPYYCLTCTQRSKGNNENDQSKIRYNKVDGITRQDILTAKRLKNRQLEINKEDRTLVFHKKCESLQNLEGFLQTYNFRLCISQGLIRQDIDNLRHSSSSNKRSINSEGLSNEERAKQKKLKVD